MTENQAWNLLVELLAHKGRLKIITSEEDHDRAPDITPHNPAYFILHDVVKITKQGAKLKAFTEEGDWCRGKPLALLNRLTEHKRYRENGLHVVGLQDTGS